MANYLKSFLAGSTRALLGCVALAAAALAAQEGAESPRALVIEKGSQAPHKITTPHFVVEYSVPSQTGRTYALLCERAYENFRKKFNVSEDEAVWDGKCQVYLFATRDELVKFASTVHKSHAAAESGGYTRITKEDPAIVLFLDKGNHTKLRQVLVHEMTHVFLQLFHAEGKIPIWLHEGFAQHFEFQCDPEHSRKKASRDTAERLVKRGQAAPLASFSNAEFPATDLEAYAQAWSLVDFMVQKGSAKMTGQFILLIKEGEPQEEALRKTFKCSLAQFESAWKRYVAQTY